MYVLIIIYLLTIGCSSVLVVGKKIQFSFRLLIRHRIVGSLVSCFRYERPVSAPLRLTRTPGFGNLLFEFDFVRRQVRPTSHDTIFLFVDRRTGKRFRKEFPENTRHYYYIMLAEPDGHYILMPTRFYAQY